MTDQQERARQYGLPIRRRFIQLAGASLTVALVSLAACGGGSSNEQVSSDPGNNNGGSNGGDNTAREQLAITAPAQTSLDIKTVSEQTVRYGGQVREQTVSSEISANITLERAQDRFVLNAITELKDLAPGFTTMRNLRLFRSKSSLNERGEALSVERIDGDIYDILAQDAFSLPAFNLSVPATAIGVGDTWTDSNQLPSLNGTLTSTVQAMDTETITVSKTLAVGSDPGQRLTVGASMQAVYARPSLLMRSADITVSIRFEDQVLINGQAQTLVEERTFTQTIREASE